MPDVSSLLQNVRGPSSIQSLRSLKGGQSGRSGAFEYSLVVLAKQEGQNPADRYINHSNVHPDSRQQAQTGKLFACQVLDCSLPLTREWRHPARPEAAAECSSSLFFVLLSLRTGGMSIRLATAEDLPTIVDISSHSFANSGCTRWLRSEDSYEEDEAESERRECEHALEDMADGSALFTVCEIENGSAKHAPKDETTTAKGKTIVGFAIWDLFAAKVGAKANAEGELLKVLEG